MLVGDFHQPLHCADRNADTGNARLIVYPWPARGGQSARSLGYAPAP
jgi:hypothetical protein